MIGPLTAGKKAVTFGYKRYGIPGAIASGGAALAGDVLVRRALQAATDAEVELLGAVLDADAFQSSVTEGVGEVSSDGPDE